MIHFKNRRHYKYNLEEDFSVATGIRPSEAIKTRFIELQTDGRLNISKGYAWDGATWVPDFSFLLSASLVHDAFYQLLRDRKLSLSYRKSIDRLFGQMLVKAGGSRWMAWLAYHLLDFFGKSHALPQVRTAP